MDHLDNKDKQKCVNNIRRCVNNKQKCVNNIRRCVNNNSLFLIFYLSCDWLVGSHISRQIDVISATSLTNGNIDKKCLI